jgi:hypothetical protein
MTKKTNPTENPSSEKPKRKRGAPPGNKNAPKHGFYAQKDMHSGIDVLDGEASTGLLDEINLIRDYMLFVLSFAYDVNSLAEALDCLRTFSLAASSLTRMIKAQELVFSGSSDIESALLEAIAVLNKEQNQE